MIVLTASFQVNPSYSVLGSLLVFFLHLFQKTTVGNRLQRCFTGWMSFQLSTNCVKEWKEVQSTDQNWWKPSTGLMLFSPNIEHVWKGVLAPLWWLLNTSTIQSNHSLQYYSVLFSNWIKLWLWVRQILLYFICRVVKSINHYYLWLDSDACLVVTYRGCGNLLFSWLFYSHVMDWIVMLIVNAFTATLKDHLVGAVTVTDYMLFWLNKHAEFQ